MSSIGLYIIIIMISYLLGSIPSAYLLGRIYGIDIRRTGSGNVGTMNTRATLGWKPAGLVLLLDLAKGMLAVYLAGIAGIDLMLAGSMAVLGHVCPLWLKFKGGKGLATGAGALIAGAYPLSVVVFLLFTLISYPFLKQIDLSNILSTIATLMVSIILYGWDSFLILLGLIIILKHLMVLKADLP
jgi:glycerol-3-phosphate acyltransferase PlsY